MTQFTQVRDLFQLIKSKHQTDVYVWHHMRLKRENNTLSNGQSAHESFFCCGHRFDFLKISNVPFYHLQILESETSYRKILHYTVGGWSTSYCKGNLKQEVGKRFSWIEMLREPSEPNQNYMLVKIELYHIPDSGIPVALVT